MEKSILICILISAVSVAGAQPVQIRLETPEPTPSRSGMSTRVSITNEEGEPYVGLREENIRFTLDDRPVDLNDMYTVFDNSAHLGVVFVVDRSGSVGGTSLKNVREAIQYLSETFAPYDRVGLVTFDSNVRVPSPVEAFQDEFERSVAMIQEGGDTALYDAIQRGSEMVNSISASRRALVVFSDGHDTRSTLTKADVVQTLRSVDWPVYGIGVGDDVKPTPLQQFASVTNGKYVSKLNSDGVSSLYAQLIRPLQELQYVLQFPVDNAPLRAMHRIQVEVRYKGKPYRAASLFSGRLVPRRTGKNTE